MKLDGFAYNNLSLLKEDNSLKLKSFVGMKKTINLKSLIVILALVFVNFSLKAQNVEESISKETFETTSVLLKELERKVVVYNEFKAKLSSLKDKNSSEYEEFYTQLRNKKEDVIIFSYETLRIRCAKENRLNEIGNILMNFDSSEASKFIEDHNFLNSKK